MMPSRFLGAGSSSKYTRNYTNFHITITMIIGSKSNTNAFLKREYNLHLISSHNNLDDHIGSNPIIMPSQREETPYTYHSSSSKQDDHLGRNPIKMPSQKEEMHYKYYASSSNLGTHVGSKSCNYPFTNRGDTLCLSSSSNLDDHIVSVH